MKVAENNGEVATFSDRKTSVSRNRLPQDSKLGGIYIGGIQPGILSADAFKWALQVGLTENEVVARLRDPNVGSQAPEKTDTEPYQSGAKISVRGGIAKPRIPKPVVPARPVKDSE